MPFETFFIDLGCTIATNLVTEAFKPHEDKKANDVIASRETHEAIKELSKIQLQSLDQQRAFQATAERANASVQEGFQKTALTLQSGFRALVKGLYRVDANLGNGLLMLDTRMGKNHQELMGFLGKGIDWLGEVIQEGKNETIDAIHQSSAAIVEAQYRTAQATIEALHTVGDSINRRLESQTEALLKMHHDLRYCLTHQDEIRARSIVLVGMRFLTCARSRRDFERALEQFVKAREVFAGYFPSHFAEGYCRRLLNDHSGAEEAFQASLFQTDPEDKMNAHRQAALANMYLGRLAFDRGQYKLAFQRYDQACDFDPSLWSALVEGMVCALKDSGIADETRVAREIKTRLNGFKGSAYLLWYLLSLTLSRVNPALAAECFEHGAYGDPRLISFRQGTEIDASGRREDRISIIALLWQLNPSNAEMLLDIESAKYPWLQ